MKIFLLKNYYCINILKLFKWPHSCPLREISEIGYGFEIAQELRKAVDYQCLQNLSCMYFIFNIFKLYSIPKKILLKDFSQTLLYMQTINNWTQNTLPIHCSTYHKLLGHFQKFQGKIQKFQVLKLQPLLKTS